MTIRLLEHSKLLKYNSSQADEHLKIYAEDMIAANVQVNIILIISK